MCARLAKREIARRQLIQPVKRHYFILVWGLAGWFATCARGGDDRSANHIGSVAGLKGQVELREGPDKPARMLDADRDLYRPLYEGVQVRCKTGGEVRLFLPNSGSTNLTSTVWITVPSGPPLRNPAGAFIPSDQVPRPGAVAPSRKATLARRALLVGINEYRPPAAGRPLTPARNGQGRRDWTDLDGCINDAGAIRAMLIARFGFEPDNILVLTDSQATRLAILDAFRRHLIESSLPGDVAFFYFAGHGSQIINTKSPEPDKRDETIVPADSNRGEKDIRDKELRRMMNAVLDREAILLALGPDPKSRDAVLIFAALDTQEIGEQKDADQQLHRAFALALLNTPRCTQPPPTAQIATRPNSCKDNQLT